MSLSIAKRYDHTKGYRIPEGITDKSPFYLSWTQMKQRCLNPNCKVYHRYGGRGIKVCDRWLLFSNFYDDMHDKHQEGLTLDRINNDGDYEPNNCRWATYTEQNFNRRNTILYQGKDLGYWSDKLNIARSTLYNRYYQHKWSLSETINTPLYTKLNKKGVN